MFHPASWPRPLILLSTIFLALAGLAVNLQAYQTPKPSQFSDVQPAAGLQTPTGGGIPAATGLETFPNSWHSSASGLVYNYISQTVWYAHQGVLSDPATIWSITSTAPYTPLQSIDLSVVNPGWSIELNNHEGIGYDPVAHTYFLADYNGAAPLRDDNLIEIDSTGVILNAWELDGASNDSSDGSLIHFVMDIAIVPGTPNRYFVTALGDAGTLYEIALTRAGLFTPASWSTVSTCTVPGMGDNVGIDYDNINGVLYHSSFNNENIVITDLSCNVLFTFSCNGGGSFHTGIAYIENSSPAEVWVTNFGSNSTTRCQIPFPMEVNAGSDQTVDEGEMVQFSGSYTESTTVLGGEATILWDFGDGSTAAGVLTPTHVYTDNGVYTVTLTITNGLVYVDQLVVTVANVAPEVTVGADITITDGTLITFTAQVIDPGADTLSYLWDFGNGDSSTALTPTSTYTETGLYTVTLTVTDNDGDSGSDALLVVVLNNGFTLYLPVINRP